MKAVSPGLPPVGIAHGSATGASVNTRVTDPKSIGKVAVLMGRRTGTRANALNGIRPRCAPGQVWPGRGQLDALPSRHGWQGEVSL